MRAIKFPRNKRLRAMLQATFMVWAATPLLADAAAVATVENDHAAPVPASVAPPATLGAQYVTPLEQVKDLKAQPLSLLARFPQAGPQLASYVAEQLIKQPSLVDAILSITNATSPEQASAIGAGIVRAMRSLSGPQQITVYREMSEKVSQTDNLWLKTSFEALGPNYRAYRAFSAPSMLPPREYANFGAAGSTPIREWKVGPAENELVQPESNRRRSEIAIGTGQRCGGNISNSQDPLCHGMIVAVIGSNASSNGAVSTSPTL